MVTADDSVYGAAVVTMSYGSCHLQVWWAIWVIFCSISSDSSCSRVSRDKPNWSSWREREKQAWLPGQLLSGNVSAHKSCAAPCNSNCFTAAFIHLINKVRWLMISMAVGWLFWCQSCASKQSHQQLVRHFKINLLDYKTFPHLRY